MIRTRRSIGLGLYAAGLVSLALAYRFSWSAGCLFDGKSGIGSLEAATPYLTKSWWAVLAALVLSASAAPAGWAKSRASAAAIGLLGALAAAPLIFVVMWVAETNGTGACAP